MAEALLDELEEVLAQERRALRAGDLDAVLRLAARKEALAGGLSAAAPEADRLRRLGAAARRNAALLAAAAAGLRSAATRLRALRGAPAELTTYDGAGRASALGAPAGEVSRRA